MWVELAAILATLVGGVTVLRVAGLRGWPLLPAGFVTGTALYILVGTVQVVSSLTTSPVLTMVVTAVVPGVVWVIAAIRGRDVGLDPLKAGLALLAVIAAVLVLRVANLLVWHVDSLVYLEMGALLAWGHFDSALNPYLLTARLIGIPLIHAPASLVDDYYLRSAVPLLAAATFAVLVWIFREGTRGLVSRRTALTIAVAGIVLLVTANRVVYHVFYLNGHLMAGTFVLMIAGAAWVLATRDDARRAPLLTMLLMAIPALVVTRPEGAVIVGLALVPLLVGPRVTAGIRVVTLATLGLSMVVWFGFVHVALSGAGFQSEWSTRLMALGGVAVVLVAVGMWLAPMLRANFAPRVALGILVSVESVLWLALVALTLRDPGLTTRSVGATLRNQVQGAWGVTVIGIAVLVVLAMWWLRRPSLMYLRFPITTFVPLVFILAHLRDAAYRVGPTDSLNRMWIQVLPIAVLYVMAALAHAEPDDAAETKAAQTDADSKASQSAA